MICQQTDLFNQFKELYIEPERIKVQRPRGMTVEKAKLSGPISLGMFI